MIHAERHLISGVKWKYGILGGSVISGLTTVLLLQQYSYTVRCGQPEVVTLPAGAGDPLRKSQSCWATCGRSEEGSATDLFNKVLVPSSLLLKPFVAALEVLQQPCGSRKKLQDNRDLEELVPCWLQGVCATSTLLPPLTLHLYLEPVLDWSFHPGERGEPAKGTRSPYAGYLFPLCCQAHTLDESIAGVLQIHSAFQGPPRLHCPRNSQLVRSSQLHDWDL